MKRVRFASRRLVLMYVGVVMFWVAATARMVQIQVGMHGRALALAQKQAEGWVDLPAQRGVIADRKGRVLATNKPEVTFAAVPAQWSDEEARRAAKRFATLGPCTTAEWLARFKSSPHFVYVARAADSATLRRVRAWKDPAIFELPEPGRSYPTGGIGRDLLGFVDVDGHGQAGIERAFDDILRGRGARVRVDYGARRDVSLVPVPVSLAEDGRRLHLTVDWEWQSVAEAAIDSAVRVTRAKGGGIILMTPTGAIRALAYATNSEFPDRTNHSRCRPATDLIEPGSIFKAISAVALLSEQKVRLWDSVYADSGVCVFGDRKIRDSEPHLWLSFAQSFVVSSNIAFGKWGQRLEGTQWCRWVHDFGFGEATGCGLPAEPRGLVPSHVRWNELEKAQLAMGHSIAVTPLQMVAAFAAFANGGNLYRPYLVEAISSPAGDTLEVGQPRKIRHLISRPVVQQMNAILARVVTEGTAKPAKSDVIDVAGKTGTAQKVREDGRGYYQDRFVSSFAGYFPAEAPQVVGIVYLDEPRTIHYGGWTAAPTFTKVAERLAGLDPTLLRYPQPEENRSAPADLPDPALASGVLPDLVGLPLARAIALASRCGFAADAVGVGLVVQQSPAAGTLLDSARQVRLAAAVCIPRDSSEVESDAILADPGARR